MWCFRHDWSQANAGAPLLLHCSYHIFCNINMCPTGFHSICCIAFYVLLLVLAVDGCQCYVLRPTGHGLYDWYKVKTSQCYFDCKQCSQYKCMSNECCWHASKPSPANSLVSWKCFVKTNTSQTGVLRSR